MMNKKGLMIKFLVTIVLALIIFAPACAVSSKLFKLSNQAKENFVDFVYEIKNLQEEGEEGEQRSSILILDDGSFIVLFKEGDDSVILGERPISPSPSFSRPENRCWDKACACLCREFNFPEDSSEADCGKIICEDIGDGIFADSWVFERNEDEDVDAYRYRRASIQLKKVGEKVVLAHI